MKDNKEKTREFKLRMYKYVIRLIKFLWRLPNDSVTRKIQNQPIQSGTSIGVNYFEAQSASSKLDYKIFSIIL